MHQSVPADRLNPHRRHGIGGGMNAFRQRESRQAGVRIGGECAAHVVALATELGGPDARLVEKELHRYQRRKRYRPAMHQQQAAVVQRRPLDVEYDRRPYVGIAGGRVRGSRRDRDRHRTRWIDREIEARLLGVAVRRAGGDGACAHPVRLGAAQRHIDMEHVLDTAAGIRPVRLTKLNAADDRVIQTDDHFLHRRVGHHPPAEQKVVAVVDVPGADGRIDVDPD